MKRLAQWGLWFGILGIIAACGPGEIFEDSSDKATRETQNEIYYQTVVFVETQVSTLAALQATADSANRMATQIIEIGAQNQALQSTLDAAARGQSGQILQPQPPAGQPADGTAVSGNSAFFPQQQPAANMTIYTEAVTATGVNNDNGCPLDNVTDFDASEDQVYMVVAAQQVQAGTTYYVRWSNNNQVVSESVNWTSDAAYDQICIWFYMEAEGRFASGNWTVELIADELPVISRSFRIGSSGGGAVGPDYANTPTPFP